MLSPDLTRSQSELYAAWRSEELESPLKRLWVRLRGSHRVERPAVVEHLPAVDRGPSARATRPAA